MLFSFMPVLDYCCLMPIVPNFFLMEKRIKKRCGWVNLKNPLSVQYHDHEWGRPVHDDQTHFEFLVLEGAQAGLSWETVLNKRERYRKVFYGFDPKKVARMSSKKVETLLQDPGIIRNRLKVESTITNAREFLKLQKEFGSFDAYIWGFVGGRPLLHSYRSFRELPATSPESDLLSKDLKKRGFKFVGSTIVYAHLQAAGLINDHELGCFFRKPRCKTD